MKNDIKSWGVLTSNSSKSTQQQASPALANLFGTPSFAGASNPPIPQIDTIARDSDYIKECEKSKCALAHTEDKKLDTKKKTENDDECSRCPVCKKCPDMDQYIKKDSIPCWNCTI
jgi:hypothetical protein